jgi:hypothetical protein
MERQVNGIVPFFAYPELHIQLLMTILAEGEYEFAVQLSQIDLPASAEYLPASQSRQFEISVLAITVEYFPATQF